MTTKRLNIKFLAILGIGGVLFLGGVYLLHEWQVQRNAAGLLKRADAAREEGDLDESARLRMRYLSHVPDSAEQYKQTAIDLKTSFIEKLKNRQELTKQDKDWAVRYVSDAVTYNGQDPEVRRLASEFWFFGKAFKLAAENLEALAELTDPPRGEWTDEDRVRYIQSLRILGGPMEEKAFAEFATTIGYDREKREFVADGSHPELLPVYRSLVVLIMARELDREAAVKILNTMVERNSDDPQAYLTRAELIRGVRGQDGVEQSHADIQTAYEKAPEDIAVIQAMSSMLLSTERAEDAKRLVQLGLDQAEERQQKSRLYKLLAEVYIRTKDNAGALDVLDRGIREVARDADLLWTKARLLLDEKRHAEVEALYKPLQEAGSRESMKNFLQARILMNDGKYRDAARGLRRIRDILPGGMQYEADLSLSECYGRLGKYDRQLASVRSLLERAPDNEWLNQTYLQILLQLGRSSDAQKFINARITKMQESGSPIPKNYEVMLATLKLRDAQLGAASLSKEEAAQLSKTLDDARNDESLTDAQRRRLVLQQLRQSEDKQAAKNKLKKMITDAYSGGKVDDETSDNYELWTLLIDFSESQEEAEKYFNIMKTKIDAEKYAASMQMLKIVIASKHSPDKLPEVLNEVESSLGQFAENEQLTLLYRMGRINLQLNNRDEGIRMIEKALESPNASAAVKAEIYNVLFEDAIKQTDAERITQLVENVRTLVGEEDEAYRILEARRIVWNIRNDVTTEAQRPDELKRARDLIQSIRSAREEWLPGILVEADLNLLNNDPRAAIEVLEVAHRFQPNNPQIIRGIAQSYRALKQPDRAEEWMNRLPSSFRSEDDNRMKLTNLWLRRNKWSAQEKESAVQLLENVAPESSEVVSDQLLRSQFYSFFKQMPKAEAAAKRAAEIAPEDPNVWTNWIKVCVELKDNQKATQVLRQAAQQLPEEEKLATLGRCFAIVGDLQKAAQTFAAALNKDKENPGLKRLLAQTLIQGKQPEAAAKLMQSIILTAEKKANEGVAATREELASAIWARRTLANLLATTNNYSNFLQALKLLEGNAVDGELAREDLAIYVGACSMRPEKSSWERAILRLEQISQRRPLTVDETFAKAALYEKFGDQYWDQVKKMATDVLSKDSDNPKRVEAYIKWLLKRGEVERAQTWADRNLTPTSVTRIRVDLHSAAKRGDYQRAAQRLQKQVPKDLELDAAKSQQLTLAAIAEELGQYDPRFFKISEALLRRLAKVAPQEILRVATLIGSRGDVEQINEALQMCVSAKSNQVPDVVSAQVAVDVLRKHPDKWNGPLAAAIQQVSQWLEQVASSDPENTLLQWRAAEFYDMIGSLDRAEAKYQAVLDSPNFSSKTDRGLVMNNLAYAMALNGKTSEPMQLIEEAEKLLPPSAEVTDTKGYIYLVNGDTEKAISAFQQAISTGRKSGHKYFHLALAFDRSNNQDKARSSWEEALAIGLERSGLPPALRPEYDKLASKFGGVATRVEAVAR